MGKKGKNIIFSLSHNGSKITGDEKILKHATQFYKELFGPRPNLKMNPNCWKVSEKVTEAKNEFLTRPFSKEEIKKVVFAMELNMALGLYHIPIEFYHACWDVANADLCNLFSKLQENKLDLGRLNYDVITLIPKVKEKI